MLAVLDIITFRIGRSIPGDGDALTRNFAVCKTGGCVARFNRFLQRGEGYVVAVLRAVSGGHECTIGVIRVRGQVVERGGHRGAGGR